MAAPSISADADSDSWLYQKSNVLRILNEFVAHDEPTRSDGIKVWAQLVGEAVLCRCAFYERLAHWMVHTYTIPKSVKNSGMPLACDSVRNYMGTAINHAATKFKAGGTIETREFFFCLDTKSSSEAAIWLHKLKKKIQRVTFERAKEAGEQQDKSEAPVYLEDVMLINRAYARAGTVEGAIRKVSVLTCQRAAGRSAEPAWMTWDGLIWDKMFKHVFVESPQPKGSKIKLVALGAGESRHSDFFIALGDYLVLQPDRALYKDDDPNWLFPELQKTSSPGTTLGNYIKALLPAERGGHKSYQNERLVVHELPPGVTAGGLRPGACNQLRAAMPSELAMHVTAHDFTSFAAFFEYIDCTRAGCMPGSVVLGGWEPLPWGQMGKGPVPPSIDVIKERGGRAGGSVDADALELCIDILFRLDNATPPMLWQKGALRPMVHAIFASMVMYFDEREGSEEMGIVLSAMCHALEDPRVKLSEGAAPVVFSRWGALLKLQFDLDNLHLRARSADTGPMQTVAAVQSLGRVVSGMHATLGALDRKVSALSWAAPPSTPQPPPSSRGQRPSQSGSAPAALPALDDTALALAGDGDGASDALSPPPLPAPPNAFSALLTASSSSGPLPTLTSRTAVGLWTELMSRGGSVPTAWSKKQEKPKALLCMKWFSAMATEDEKALMKPPADPTAPPPDDGERRKLAAHMHDAIVGRLHEFYADAELPVPRELAKEDHQLPASGIASHVEKLNPKLGGAALDVSAFRLWRVAWDAAQDAAAASAGPPKKKPKKK